MPNGNRLILEDELLSFEFLSVVSSHIWFINIATSKKQGHTNATIRIQECNKNMRAGWFEVQREHFLGTRWHKYISEWATFWNGTVEHVQTKKGGENLGNYPSEHPKTFWNRLPKQNLHPQSLPKLAFTFPSSFRTMHWGQRSLRHASIHRGHEKNRKNWVELLEWRKIVQQT